MPKQNALADFRRTGERVDRAGTDRVVNQPFKIFLLFGQEVAELRQLKVRGRLLAYGLEAQRLGREVLECYL